MKTLSFIVSLSLLLTGTQKVVANEEALNAVPVPDNATMEPVTINMLQNGHRLSIANLEVVTSIESALQFYREQWSEPLAEGVPGFVENTADDWSVISRPHDGWNQVVQFRPSKGKVEARISVLRLEPSPDQVPQIAMPGNARLVSSTGANDVGHDSSTYVIFSDSGIQSVSEFYRRHFNNEGWSRVSDKHVNNAQVMLLQRTGERAELVVSRMPSGGTLTIINKVLDNG